MPRRRGSRAAPCRRRARAPRGRRRRARRAGPGVPTRHPGRLARRRHARGRRAQVGGGHGDSSGRLATNLRRAGGGLNHRMSHGVTPRHIRSRSDPERPVTTTSGRDSAVGTCPHRRIPSNRRVGGRAHRVQAPAGASGSPSESMSRLAQLKNAAEWMTSATACSSKPAARSASRCDDGETRRGGRQRDGRVDDRAPRGILRRIGAVVEEPLHVVVALRVVRWRTARAPRRRRCSR